MNRGGPGRGSLLAAFILIGVGTVLLLRNLDVIDVRIRLWPVILLALGVWALLGRFTIWRGYPGGFVFPLVLITIGGVLVLRDLGHIRPDFTIWPAILIAVGIGILLEALPRGGPPAGRDIAIPLDGATSARIRIEHGAGRLRVDGSAPPGTIVKGRGEGSLESEVRREGDVLEVRLRRGSRGWWGGPAGWTLGLAPGTRLELVFKTGATETELALRELTVTDLSLDTGASKTDLELPAAGHTRVRVKAGAAGVDIRVPQGVAARIRARTGLAGVEIDQTRFPRSGDHYVSPDFETAEHRAEIDIEGGVAGFTVR